MFSTTQALYCYVVTYSAAVIDTVIVVVVVVVVGTAVLLILCVVIRHPTVNVHEHVFTQL